uniref:EF-hand domain-containing protein n=1 Tax=Alexandrium monilatum TaxID=311494 RepID=A0A7S4VGZ0_9DINO
MADGGARALVASPEETPQLNKAANVSHRGDYIALVDAKDDLEASASPSTADTSESGRPRHLRGVAKNLHENLQKDLFKQLMSDADERDRLETVNRKVAEAESEHEKTQSRIAEIHATLKTLSDPVDGIVWAKEKQIKEVQATIDKLLQQQEEHEAAYQKVKLQIQESISQCRSTMASLENEVNYLQSEVNGNPDEGPPGLRWVLGDRFMLFSALVILSNLLTMYLQFIHPSYNFAILNVLFLVFYQVELVLNLIVKRKAFFIGEFSTVVFNWLDLIIVVSGTVEFVVGLRSGGHTSYLGALRVLRVARLARVFKIVRFFIQSDMSWAEGPAFQSVMMAVIAFNTILMGLEVQYEDCGVWPLTEQILMVIYVFELMVRLKVAGCGFFSDSKDIMWNWLDLIIVMGGVIDLWLMPGITAFQRLMGASSHHSGKLSQIMSMVRMARLARVLRLVRLVKGIPPLYTLVVGIATAMQGMGWVMVLTGVVLYICALLGVQFVGKGWVLPSDMDDHQRQAVQNTFKDIPEAIFNLFKAMNADLGGMEPLLKAVPQSKYVMMAFMVVTNWAIFSILTAVVSDNMAKVTEEHTQEMERVEEATRKEVRAARLEFLFQRLDKDHDGIIDLQEFRNMLNNDVAAEEMSTITHLAKEDLGEIFDLLSETKDGGTGISYHSFVNLLDKECSQVTARSIMKLERRLTQFQDALESGLHATPKT